MSVIQVHDKKFQPYIGEAELQLRIKEMAALLNKDLEGERPLFIAILNGSFMFAADIFKHLTIEAEISFIKLVSYKGTKSSGNVITAIGLDEDLYGRTVVILEDIVDTGNTIVALYNLVNRFKVKSINTATLFFKPEAYKQNIAINHIGFSIENKFIVGYGLDYNKQGRNLGEVYQIK